MSSSITPPVSSPSAYRNTRDITRVVPRIGQAWPNRIRSFASRIEQRRRRSPGVGVVCLLQKRRQLLPNMQQSLSELLFPGYRRRVLGLLLLHPDEALHGREIARRTGLPAGTLNRELARLAQAGLLKRERRGNQLLYSAERGCPVFEELA